MQEALVGLFPAWLPSRKSCRKAIDRGEVWCNGKPAITATRVCEGDQIQYKPVPAEAPNPGPVADQNLNIVRPQSADFALVWKPAGLATSGTGLHNLAAIIAFQSQNGHAEKQRLLRPDAPDGMPAPHPVHRLDRATSGWVCVALTLKAAQSLGLVLAAMRPRVPRRPPQKWCVPLTRTATHAHPHAAARTDTQTHTTYAQTQSKADRRT